MKNYLLKLRTQFSDKENKNKMDLKSIKEKSREEAIVILIDEYKERFDEVYKFRLGVNKVGLKNSRKKLKDASTHEGVKDE